MKELTCPFCKGKKKKCECCGGTGKLPVIDENFLNNINVKTITKEVNK